MHKSNIITQAWVYLLITLAKHRAFMGKNYMIYDRPSETVPEKCFGLFVVVSYNYKAARHILESEYNMPHVNYQYQPLCPFFSEVGQKNLLFAYAMVGH